MKLFKSCVSALLACATVTLAACEEENDENVPIDAAIRPIDAALTPPDGAVDASQGLPDAFLPPFDAALPPPDAALTVVPSTH